MTIGVDTALYAILEGSIECTGTISIQPQLRHTILGLV
jgi:hypothetical protein